MMATWKKEQYTNSQKIPEDTELLVKALVNARMDI